MCHIQQVHSLADSPAQLPGDLVHTLQRLRADRSLNLAEQSGGESATTVQPPPRHLPLLLGAASRLKTVPNAEQK